MIDLSALTDEERAQFADTDVLEKGSTNVALYLRYSSHSQSEQSIEGQLRDCISFCHRNDYKVAGVFVDRATSANKNLEKRVALTKLVEDSKKKEWNYIVVWKLDRFARNRNDSAILKSKLKKYNVRVLSATENLTDSPESIILESVLEGMAEFYSADLSQKVSRGMRETALKCNSTGGRIPLGFTVKDHKLVINPQTAPIVQEAFERYAEGESIAEIARSFNTRGFRTTTGKPFTSNSFHAMFANKRYYGTYIYKDIEIENGLPAIIGRDLFDAVRVRAENAKTGQGRHSAKTDYLLSGKLFCGHCGASMQGTFGTSKTGQLYYYYICHSRRKAKSCPKKPIRKEWIEDIVINDAVSLLTDEVIDQLADVAIEEWKKEYCKSKAPYLSNRLNEIEKSIAGIVTAVEKGIASETLMKRLTELEKEKKEVERSLQAEKKNIFLLEKVHIVYWLEQFRKGDITNKQFRRRLCDLFIDSVYVYDEPDVLKITTAYNLLSLKDKTIIFRNSGENQTFEFDNCAFLPTITSKRKLKKLGKFRVCETKVYPLP